MERQRGERARTFQCDGDADDRKSTRSERRASGIYTYYCLERQKTDEDARDFLPLPAAAKKPI